MIISSCRSLWLVVGSQGKKKTVIIIIIIIINN